MIALAQTNNIFPCSLLLQCLNWNIADTIHELFCNLIDSFISRLQAHIWRVKIHKDGGVSYRVDNNIWSNKLKVVEITEAEKGQSENVFQIRKCFTNPKMFFKSQNILFKSENVLYKSECFSNPKMFFKSENVLS